MGLFSGVIGGSAMPDLESLGIEKAPQRGRDSEAAYIVRQNAMLKATAFILGALLVLFLILSLTVLEVNVQRKSTLKAKIEMRHEQIGDHRDIVRKDLAVQNALQEEMNELQMVREARASLGALLGRYMEDMDQTMEAHAQGDIKLMKGVRVLHDRFAKHLKILMDHVYREVKKEQDQAQTEMKQVGDDIEKEASEEENEETKYEKDMQDEPEKDEMEKETEEASIVPAAEGDDASVPPVSELAATGKDDVDMDTTIRRQLSNFFTKFHEAQSYRLEPAVYQDWTKFWDTEVVKMLEDSTTEEAGKARADLVEKMKKKIGEQIKLAYTEQQGPPQRFFEQVLDSNHALQPELMTALSDLEQKMNLPSAEKPTEKKHKPLEIVAELEKIAEKHVKLPLKWMWTDDKDELPEFNEEESYDQATKEDDTAAKDDGKEEDKAADA